MTMFWTTLVFLAVSALFVAHHLWRGRAAGEAPPAMACPRCGGAVPPQSRTCVGCGAPAQVFEIVVAPVAPPVTRSEGPLHAVVRADLCVGCGTCVAACPEPGALRLVDNVATVDLERCKGHASCVAACPISAIAVTQGEAGRRVEVPLLSPHFESNVPQLYIVGELGGRGRIKNAINEVKIAVEHVVRTLHSRGSDAARDDAVLDFAIVGSGPAGLSAALEANREHLHYVVLEQGTLSETIARYPREKLLIAGLARTPLYGDLWVADASKETLLRIWTNVIATHGLDIRTGQRVERVEREPDGFRVRTQDREYQARAVLLAMGRRGTPRRLGVPGEELDKVFYDIAEMEAFAGRRVLVVGGGESAAESALGLANQEGTTVSLSYRGAQLTRATERSRAKLEAAAAAGRIRLLLESQVREIRRSGVVLDVAGAVRTIPNDVVIVRIGGELPSTFLERIGVRIVSKEIPLEPAYSAAAA